jgi:hypothetical protein
MRRTLVALGLAAALSLSVRAGDPTPARVAATTWSSRHEDGLGTSARFRLPPGLVERLLVERELQGGALDATPRHRVWLAEQLGLLVGCGAKQELRDGRPPWTAERCGLTLDGPNDGRSGAEELFQARLAGFESTEVEGGFDWSARLVVKLDGRFQAEVRLRGTLRLGVPEKAPHRHTITFDGPHPPTVPTPF